MELTIGEHAGFCFGVRRAVCKAFECASNGLPCVTLGPLIHNPQEVERLDRAGVRSVASLDEVEPGQTVIIRSHGVTPEVYAQCEARGIPVIDATCPHVAHIHQLVSQYSEQGGAVIIVGEADHPEVVGIAGWAHGPVFILPTAEAARAAALPAQALVVAQTTIRRDRFEEVLCVVKARVPELTVRMTICAATSQRQQEAERLSKEADVMIVVGGRNSSNTQKLLETCRLRCGRAYLVETPQDVPEGIASPEDRIAITAGASTPQWLLEAVRARVEALATGKAQGAT
ncbi:MAG: 4-hydroxy-3-methylbut-2-enyl diphosphate reductase [Clostridiales bacterium]|nr:4-hydroxy-3-methylbut-2-enyl diphosphate reductase [Clostridiales bacterium]MDY5515836.1 4-hydroxy-3-methylbut-2-enyl diphosphate reductase [Candidatus Ventricola sp.]